jgi:hypothetical protein
MAAVSDGVRPVLEVATASEGEEACELLRASGIKCLCVELPSEAARRSPTRFLTAIFSRGMAPTVIVAAADEERARTLLAGWTPADDAPGQAPDPEF